MVKKCKIYYGVVVEEAIAQKWSSIGSYNMEPIKVETREPLGKEPEFCCEQFKAEFEANNIHFYYRFGEEVGFMLIFARDKTIRFCPFCGAEIVFEEHLKLKVVATILKYSSYHYEVVE